MKAFHCTHCQNLVFFENVRCLSCERQLAYLPDRAVMAAIEPAGDGLWRADGAREPPYRLCRNYEQHNVCNWAVPAGDPQPLCASCRLTHVIPDLASPENKLAWYRLEVAKRRLVYTLRGLKLPVSPRCNAGDGGLAFEFLDAPPGGGDPVLTGHDDGVIVINIAEADDVKREQQRQQQHEPYRTLLGHFRHEIGHYYWDRLIRSGTRLGQFRRIFGDERAGYGECLRRHYADGPPANWQVRFISAYAAVHPWEDWAESWAHFLLIADTLETAGAAGLSLNPTRADEPALAPPEDPLAPQPTPFERMIEDWLPLTYVLNSLNRGLGLPDGYPFVLTPPILDKLRFIHETIYASR